MGNFFNYAKKVSIIPTTHTSQQSSRQEERKGTAGKPDDRDLTSSLGTVEAEDAARVTVQHGEAPPLSNRQASRGNSSVVEIEIEADKSQEGNSSTIGTGSGDSGEAGDGDETPTTATTPTLKTQASQYSTSSSTSSFIKIGNVKGNITLVTRDSSCSEGQPNIEIGDVEGNVSTIPARPEESTASIIDDLNRSQATSPTEDTEPSSITERPIFCSDDLMPL